MEQLAVNATIQMVRQAAVNKSSKGINEMFAYRGARTTRRDNRYRIESENTYKRGKRNLLNRGKNQYNSLPPELRDMSLKTHSHKKLIKKRMAKKQNVKMHSFGVFL